MEVATDVVNLGKAQMLITNNGPDTLFVGEVGQDQDNWFPLESGSALTVKAFNTNTGVVSDGVSDVGVLLGGTGIFPPGVDLGAIQVYGQPQPIVTVTGTTHTVSSVEAGSLYRCTSNSPVTITVPKDVTDDVPDGVYYDVEQVGTGQVSVAAESGATCTPPSGLSAATRVQGSRLGLQKTAANTWSIFGDMEAA